MEIIRASYMGHMDLDGDKLFCTSMGSKIESNPLFYDLVVGLRDSCVAGTTKGDGGDAAWGTTQHQRRIWRMSPWTVRTSFSGPVFTTSTVATEFSHILSYAIHGKKIPTARTTYWKDGWGHIIYDAFITNLNIDVMAGEPANYTVEMAGKDLDEHQGGSGDGPVCSKMITWDVCTIGCSAITDNFIQGYTLTINNPPIPIYTADNNNPDHPLAPSDLRLGIQEVSGTIKVYGLDTYFDQEDDIITITFPGISASFHATYSPSDIQVSGGSSPVIYSIPFVGTAGISHYGGPVWISAP